MGHTNLIITGLFTWMKDHLIKMTVLSLKIFYPYSQLNYIRWDALAIFLGLITEELYTALKSFKMLGT